MLDEEFDERVRDVIKANVHSISSSADSQESEEAYNTGAFELPNPAGKAGGACTSAFLDALYNHGEIKTWVDLLHGMREELQAQQFNQLPQLSSSRKIDVREKMNMVPSGSGRRRALLIGINYTGQKGELKSCHNDCNNVREFLLEVFGFQESEMLILMDDGIHQPPTRKNIEDGMVRLTKYSQPGDVVFVSFSGHGGQVVDISGDEEDGFDESIIPSDFREEGQIIDDDILKLLIKPMPEGVTATLLFDCCHSGTVTDLPYTLGCDDNEMHREAKFNMDVILGDANYREIRPDDDDYNEHGGGEDGGDYDGNGDGTGDGTGEGPYGEEHDQQKQEEEDEEMLGPKLDDAGAPTLPVRKVRKKKEDGTSDAPKRPPKKCTIM